MKKCIAFILIAALAMCCCVSAGAAVVYRYGDWTLSAISGDAGICFGVRSYEGSDAVVTVPDDYGGYPIIMLGAYAFAGNETLSEITLGGNITVIGDGAFTQCSSLEKIHIPDSVTAIGDDAFLGCENAVIYGRHDSYAIEYAKEHDLDYVRTDIVTYMLGDADGDGIITIFDVAMIQRLLIGLPVPNPELTERNGDVNGDGLDISDATMIQRHLAKMDIGVPIGMPAEAVIS